MRSRELRAILWLLPLLAIGFWLAMQAKKGGYEPPRTELRGMEIVETTPRQDTLSTEKIAPQLFRFDPNTISYHDLLRLGFTRGEALGIVKYRERGKVFEIAEDFAACYQVSEAMFARLAPYIIIGEKFRLKKFPARREDNTDFRRPEVQVAPSGGSKGEEIGVVERIQVNLNTADTTALVAVRGIGSITAARIVEYRGRLGGFVDVIQLAEVRGVTEQNFELMKPQIFVDTTEIQKISVNFAPAKVLATHPYISPAALRKLLKLRQLKGGWSTPEELLDDKIFTQEQLDKLLPYLSFEQ